MIATFPNIRCIACVYCLNDYGNEWKRHLLEKEQYQCQHTNRGFSLVTGWTQTRTCQDAREDPADCGPDGKWYELKQEPKPSSIEFVPMVSKTKRGLFW